MIINLRKLFNNPLIFSLLFIPIKFTKFNFFNESENLLQNSDINIDGANVQNIGITIPFVTSDLIYLFFLILLFKQKIKIDRNKLFCLSFIFLSISLAPFFLEVEANQKFIIFLYSLRFIFYASFFCFESEFVFKYLRILEFKSFYYLPILACLINTVNNYSIYLPNLFGARVELYGPLYLIAFLSFAYHRIEKKKIPNTANLFFVVLLFASGLSQKRAFIGPILILFIVYFLVLFIRFLFTSKLRLPKLNLYLMGFVTIILILFSQAFLNKTFTENTLGLGVQMEYGVLINSFGLTDSVILFDYSIQQRTAKILLSLQLLIDKPLALIFPSGVNSFRIIYGFLPDSLFQYFFEFGLVSSILFLYLSTNIKYLRLVFMKDKGTVEILFLLFPICLIIGFGISTNIYNVVYVLPPLAFYSCYLDLKFKNNRKYIKID